MALARTCMKNSSFCPLPSIQRSFRGMQGFEPRRPRSVSCSYSSSPSPSSSNSNEKAGDNQVAVQATSSPADTSRDSGRGLLWRNPLSFLPFRFRNNAPTISDLRSLANTLVQLPNNLKYKLLGHRVKEDDKCYKLRFEVPGLSKNDLKITVEDRFLVITGERKEEEDEDDGDDGWYSQMYGWYNTSVLLPDDAKVDEIKAEVKDGLLCVTVPRDEKKKRNVYKVEIQ